MGELESIIAELERKKEHIQRAIDELKQAELTRTPEDRRAQLEAEAERERRSRASRRGWERRKTGQAEPSGPQGGAEAA